MSDADDVKVVANWFAANGDRIYHANIYVDGIVLCLACGKTEAEEWAQELACTEHARSDDGMLAVLILRDDNPSLLFSVLGAIGQRRYQKEWQRYATYCDNRQLDANTVDSFVEITRVSC